MKNICSVMAVLAATGVAVPAFADPATIVNLSAYEANTIGNVPLPVTQTFGPGTYTVSVVGKAGGGLYDAWAPAVPSAGNWEDRYMINYGTTSTAVNPYSGQRFATPEAAFSAFSSVLTTFTLAVATAVTFSIPDYLFSDNAGGVSLGIVSGTPAQVPEPGTIGLFGLAGAMLLFARYRKRLATAA